MGVSPKLLGDGEHVVVSTRTHAKALVGPVLVFIVICAVGGFLAALAPPDQDWLTLVIGALAAVAILVWVVWPFLNWFFASYTVTNRRLITRHGIITRRGHDLPLRRINDVSYERQLLDRMLGCGTLVISAASEQGQILLPDVPHVEHLHLQITELLFGQDLGGDGADRDLGRR
ncbi:MAG: PH domain-containing protein [Propionibacteriales bacterium]|nr:PH domain-containing protein [Propionibacteriales bacterium]